MAQASNLLEKREKTHFKCTRCRKVFKDLPPRRTEDAPDEPHPYFYFSICPDCGIEMPEAPFMRTLYRAHQNITGTKSPKASARNLPANRTHFGNLKNGIFAKQARIFPARPGKYPECEDCPQRESEDCVDAGACLEITKLYMRVEHAVANKDHKALSGIMASTQTGLAVMLQRMLRAVDVTGVELKAPIIATYKDGYDLVKDEDGTQVYEFSAHPLIKPIVELISKNNMSLADLGLTPKQAGEEERAMGHLDNEKMAAQTEAEYQRQLGENNERLLAMFDMAKQTRKDDPVYQEHIKDTAKSGEEEEGT